MKFIVIGISDAPSPWFPPEVMEIVRKGKVFSGGKRHHEMVARLLPDGARWIDITVPLDHVFEQYAALSSLHTPHSSSIIVFASGDPLFSTPCSSALPIPSVARCPRRTSNSIRPSTHCRCWLIGWSCPTTICASFR